MRNAEKRASRFFLLTRRKLIACSVGASATLVAACGGLFSHRSNNTPALANTLPHLSPPAYPNFADRNAVIAQAQALSDKLEQYVKDWLDGKVSATLPDELLPDGRDPNISGYYLQKPEEVVPEQQWAIREAQAIDFHAALGQYSDPHATYLLTRWFYAPFGCKVIISGQFPHSRFFDIQLTPSFYPEAYRYNGFVGVGEVPIVDADIDPLPGHINPFRVGADRTASERGYEVTYDLAIGNPVDLNPAFRPPTYRAPGNHRVGGAIMYQGPWGEQRYNPPGNGRGVWDTGSVWIRYYAPDKSAGALGGVPLPKMLYQLPDGRQFYINADFSKWVALKNQQQPFPQTKPEEPYREFERASFGWRKQWGIFRAIVEGILPKSVAYTRALDKGVAGRGEDLPAPCNLEPSATCCTYINYLGRGMSLGEGKVVVLAGKLPSTPRTRDGEATMQEAQARYWSLTSYPATKDYKSPSATAALTSIMDDEITVDEQGRYIIVYSRPENRPQNATTENGVTWLNWGPVAHISWTLRWLSVAPHWSFAYTPDEKHLGWETDTASSHYNPQLIGENNQNGFLGEYQPLVHYMTQQQFEQLGNALTPGRIPEWK